MRAPGAKWHRQLSLNAELAGKTVELIHEMVPSSQRVAALANAADPTRHRFSNKIQLAGEATGTAIDPIMIHSAEELDAAFPAMVGQRPKANVVQPSLATKRAADLAISYRIAAVCAWRQFPNDGGLAVSDLASPPNWGSTASIN